ncbi:replication-associated recombination protein A [Aeoliella sp.]|uniref:replication-associated recombination protein A n=1 Tax=Aeoliella sp. TaxID=2795800 RepID=UPI003CCBEE0C
MSDLFAKAEEGNLKRVAPLAARMRPRMLQEFAGQQHLVGEGQLLWRLLKAQKLGSVIFYGPPGTGKTTLARLLAQHLSYNYRQLSAVTSGVKDLREVLEAARDNVATGGKPTLLFLDEIHRFNRAQQDALLPDVEDGVVILVGATTSNPFFAVNSALVSRSRVFEFQPLTPDDIRRLLEQAIADPQRGLGRYQIEATDEALDFLANICDGDARQALSTLEIAVLSSDPEAGPVKLTKELMVSAVQRRAVNYDTTGDEHYDCASALIKSIRGSDPDAALYWLARMLEGGEDVRFICRRLVILASEDIGNADPHALPLAVAAMQATEFVGLPECQLTLSQAVTYLACAPKSNAATTAISAARSDIREGRTVQVPRHLRDAHYSGAKRLGNGEGYEYSHNSEDGVAAQDYLGVDREYYQPTERGFEQELQTRLQRIREKLRSAKPEGE